MSMLHYSLRMRMFMLRGHLYIKKTGSFSEKNGRHALNKKGEHRGRFVSIWRDSINEISSCEVIRP
jgi:hypothetical protein